MAKTFWNRWWREYLHTLQPRRNWKEIRPDLNAGDFALVCEKDLHRYLHRNEWSVAVVVDPVKSSDGHVRRAVLKLFRNNKVSYFTCPITKLVRLMSIQIFPATQPV